MLSASGNLSPLFLPTYIVLGMFISFAMTNTSPDKIVSGLVLLITFQIVNSFIKKIIFIDNSSFCC